MLVVTNGLVEVQCLDLDDLAGAFVGFEGGKKGAVADFSPIAEVVVHVSDDVSRTNRSRPCKVLLMK
jgi:hypothetical protein